MYPKISVFIIMICFFCSVSSQNRRALVIGLGQYEDRNWSTVHGDKDVSIVLEILKEYEYNDIQTLVNSQATKDKIVLAFKQLAQKCQPNDKVYIHFSGHGQRMTDLDGDEEDGLDEAWIPYDAYLRYGEKDKGEKHLVDDEIGILLTQIRKQIGINGQLLVVVDACHSGDSSRELEEGYIRGTEVKFIIPLSRPVPKKSKESEYWLTLSACKHYQMNSELSNGIGKLTYGLYVHRKKLCDMSNEQIESTMKKFVDEHRKVLPQTPVLSGQRELYSIKNLFEKIK